MHFVTSQRDWFQKGQRSEVKCTPNQEMAIKPLIPDIKVTREWL